MEVPKTAQSALDAIPRSFFEIATGTALNQDSRGYRLPPPDVLIHMMTQLECSPQDSALHVGCGTGYLTAVLAQLCREVYACEQDRATCEEARNRLILLGFRNIHLVCADGSQGLPSHAPYQIILLSSTSLSASERLLAQLAPGGRMIHAEGTAQANQRLTLITRDLDGTVRRQDLGSARLVNRLGLLLEERGHITREQVDEALQRCHASKRRIGEELLLMGALDEENLYRTLAFQAGLPFARFDDLQKQIDPAFYRIFPRPFLLRARLIPLYQEGEQVHVASKDPESSLAELSHTFPNRQWRKCLVTPTVYQRLLAHIDLAGRQRAEPMEPIQEVQATPEARSQLLLDTLLLDAIGERASDIHLEPFAQEIHVRLRVDGDLRTITRFPLNRGEYKALVNVIKLRAGLDISEHRLPQGGRSRFQSQSQRFDLRIQIQPGLHGEHAVIRLLPQTTKMLEIEELGFPVEIASEYRRLLESPVGLILVVGPTGSGKSTTLYAGLQFLASDPTRKIITVEDPIEYSIEGILQTQVKPHIGFVFSEAMRSFVRLDPDVILVGEIRDGETALEAIRASQTGHVVLSTLHCNDAVDAVQRMADLGTHANSLASELLAVLAQRLAKRICPRCKRPEMPTEEMLREVFPSGAPADFAAFSGQGCPSCMGFGTHGRIAVLEYLRASENIRDLISSNSAITVLRKEARKAGLFTMRQCALMHVQSGLIPFKELRQILPAERMAEGL
jgi:type IV pilus assembly protein PilB